jgi:hypothetical protein
MAERLASALVGLYPRAWREQYGQEMQALLEDTAVTPGTVVDLIGGGDLDPGDLPSAIRRVVAAWGTARARVDARARVGAAGKVGHSQD